MDLYQHKLSKLEWESIEIPITKEPFSIKPSEIFFPIPLLDPVIKTTLFFNDSNLSTFKF